MPLPYDWGALGGPSTWAQEPEHHQPLRTASEPGVDRGAVGPGLTARSAGGVVRLPPHPQRARGWQRPCADHLTGREGKGGPRP